MLSSTIKTKINFGTGVTEHRKSCHRKYRFVVRHPIRTRRMTSPKLPHAIFSTFAGAQFPDTKPACKRAKNASALSTTQIYAAILRRMQEMKTNHDKCLLAVEGLWLLALL